ncbi:hypothetical protein D3C75_1047140 [compost metagenome]
MVRNDASRNGSHIRYEIPRLSRLMTVAAHTAMEITPTIVVRASSFRCRRTISITAGIRNTEAKITQVRLYLFSRGMRRCAK